jgi:hypothetical protein
MYKISIIGVHDPILLIAPFVWKSPSLSLYSLFTYLESLLCVVVRSRPLRSLVGCQLTSPPPHLLPIPSSLSPMVPHFKYMPSYDDITISSSHSPIQPWLAFKSGGWWAARFSKEICLIGKIFGVFQNLQFGSAFKSSWRSSEKSVSNRSKGFDLAGFEKLFVKYQ